MRKQTFYTFSSEAPYMGSALLVFQDSSIKFSVKIRKKKVHFWVIIKLMPQSRGYSALNGPISHGVTHKTVIFKNENNQKAHLNFSLLFAQNVH